MNWYRELNSLEKRTFKAAFAGWGLDAFDLMTFTFVITTFMTVFRINKGQAGMLGTVTLLVSAAGGWIAGILADRYGRVRVLQGTVLWFSCATMLIGFAHSLGQVFIFRALQGLGYGGEWAIGAVLMGEIIRPEHRGKAVGTVQSAYGVGWGCSALAYAAVFSLFKEAIAWRVLFLIGILPGLLLVYYMRNIPEPEISAKARRSAELEGGKVPFWTIFSQGFVKTTLLTSLLCIAAQGGFYSINVWLPTFLKTKWGLSVMETTGYMSVVLIANMVGFVVGAYLTDYLGRRLNTLIFAIFSAVSIFVYTHVQLTNHQMLIFGFFMGIGSPGVFSNIGAWLTELFPSNVRATGLGFAYNVGRGIGALFPAVVGILSEKIGLGSAIGIFGGGAYASVVLAAVLLPETRGRDLHILENSAVVNQAESGLKGKTVEAGRN